MNVLAHNLIAMNSRRVYGENWVTQSKSMEKLSSGYRINRSADDASGLAISEKMRRQIRGLSQARDNVQDGISMVQIADGALEEVHDMLQRGNELMIKAANGTLSDSDRESINMEIQQLKDAIDGIAASTKFNELRLFPPDGVSPVLANMVVSKSYTLDFNNKGVYKVTQKSGEIGTGSASSVNKGNLLAEKIATEYVPNAVNQILGRFSSLKDSINSGYTGTNAEKLKMALDIKYIDGSNGTLAQVKASFAMPGQTLSVMMLEVDSSDFTEDDIKNNSPKLGMLESTIGHEMMHAVMDAALPSGMCPDGSSEDFPKWFKEGTAQLAGGGYATGWNEYLQDALKNNFSDDKIAELLRKNTVQNNVYGHGYLAAAYLGQLASGSSNVSAQNIASGMNRIFKKLTDEPSKDFETAVNEVLQGTGKTLNDVINDINNGKQAGVSFVRKLTAATNGNGAGSVIAAGGLSATPSNVLGTSPQSSKIYIDGFSSYGPDLSPGNAGTTIQAGADSDFSNRIALKLFRMSSKDLGIESIGTEYSSSGQANTIGDANTGLSMAGAERGIELFSYAIDLVSGVRSYYGAVQNRMEHTVANLENVIENTTDAESRIRDTDMASEMVKMTLGRILIQAGQAMMAQSNHSNDWILGFI